MSKEDYTLYVLDKKEKRYCFIVAYISAFVFSYVFYASIGLSCICGFLAFLAYKPYARYKGQKRSGVLLTQFRDMLYSLSSSISAGRQMPEALAAAKEHLELLYNHNTPMIRELSFIVNSIFENRASEKAILQDFSKRSGCEDIQSFVDVYFICRSTGGDVSRVIENTTDILMDKLAVEKEIKALTSQKIVEGRIIAAMPLAVIIILNVISPDYLQVLYSTIEGRFIMTIALGGMIYAYKLIQKYSKIEI